MLDISMLNISPLGWVHTLSSLPAIPAAAYMFIRFGRIVPRSTAGIIYFVSMLLGAVTVVFIAKESISYGIAAMTLLLLFVGYGVGLRLVSDRARPYVETICLTWSAFMLMVPTVNETLHRVPVGNPLVTSNTSPVLLGAVGFLFLCLIIGLTAQIKHLRKEGRLHPAGT